MFTGIITHLGKLKSREGSVFTFNADQDFCKKIKKGTSLAINGACLTISKKTNTSFSVEAIPETLKKTMLGQIKIGNLVNLELPLTLKDFLSGHLVQGHIDGVVKLVKITQDGNSYTLKFSISNNLSNYLVKKGSIAINGISLTVTQVKKGYFTVGIIPYTWNNTMMHTIKLGDFVNIEADILAKYLSKLLKK